MAIHEYYQVGGFHSNLPWFIYDDNNLARAVAGDESPLRPRTEDSKAPVELVLGIKRSGASCLLLTIDQVRLFVKHLRLPSPKGAPLRSEDFESLSPSQFLNAEELSKKLSLHKPKHKKGRVGTDNSQANKQFASGEDGIHRGAFEHGRVMYRVLKNDIDANKFGLEDLSWSQSVRVCSLTFNSWAKDTRHSREQLKNPKIMDIGWTEVAVPDLGEERDVHSSVHIILRENRLLGQGAKEIKFGFGNTEQLDSFALSSRLKEFFKDNTRMTDKPIVLLVNGDEVTRNVIRNLGVDISQWESGIKGLLGLRGVGNESSPSLPNDPRRQYYSRTNDPGAHSRSSRSYHDYDRPRHRSRSRSPRRGYDHGSSEDSKYMPSSRRSPSRYYSSSSNDKHTTLDYTGTHATYAPVYIVDIQQMYIKLFQTRDDAESIANIARHLHLTSDEAGWCAGNESRQAIDIWRTMVEGPSIDDQRARRSTPATAGEAKEETAEEVDDDMDPSDYVQASSSAARVVYEEDESDYGEDSDDD